MYEGDRGKRTALVDWVFPTVGIVGGLVLAMWIGYQIGLTPPNPPDYRQQKEYVGAKARYSQAAAGNIVDAQTNYAAYPDGDAYKCYYAQNHDSADLCAQWRAAIAAERSALWGFWVVVVSALGTATSLIGLGALIYTLRQTDRSLEAARTSNEIARNNIESEQRPWMDFELIELGASIADNINLMPTVSAENIGRSPAVFVTCVPAFMMHVVSFKLPDLSEELNQSMEEIFEIPGLRSETIFPGKKRTLMYPAKCVNPEAFEIYRADNSEIWITLAIRIAYKFGSSLRWTDHYFKVAGPKWGAGDVQRGLNCHLATQPISTIPQVGGSVN